MLFREKVFRKKDKMRVSSYNFSHVANIDRKMREVSECKTTNKSKDNKEQ